MLKVKSLKVNGGPSNRGRGLSLLSHLNYTYQTLNPYYYRVGLLESPD